MTQAPSRQFPSNGDILVQGTTRGGILGTSNGAIEIDTIDGSASAKTSNGRVTSNGRIEVELTDDASSDRRPRRSV